MERLGLLDEIGFNASDFIPHDHAQYLGELGPWPAYLGIDLTGISLHLGHLIPLVWMAAYRRSAGTRCYLVLGEFTTRIGDPTGRKNARIAVSDVELLKNTLGILRSVKALFPELRLISNLDWLRETPLTEMLHLMSKVTLNEMLSWSAFKPRIQEGGLTLTELAYPFLQAMDFKVLHSHLGVKIQVAGQDQINNLKLGRRFINGESAGVLLPLLTNSQGEKIGKTGGGKIPWLSSQELSGLDFIYFSSLAWGALEKVGTILGVGIKVILLAIVKILWREISEDVVDAALNGKPFLDYSGDCLQFLIRYVGVKNLAAARGLLKAGAFRVNSQRVLTRQCLNKGDVVLIGDKKFILV